jgi:hypothetical protein
VSSEASATESNCLIPNDQFQREREIFDRGSTPAQQRLWGDGIYDQIREVMPLQGSLSIERICQMVPVSRSGFYQSLQEQQPVGKKFK